MRSILQIYLIVQEESNYVKKQTSCNLGSVQ